MVFRDLGFHVPLGTRRQKHSFRGEDTVPSNPVTMSQSQIHVTVQLPRDNPLGIMMPENHPLDQDEASAPEPLESRAACQAAIRRSTVRVTSVTIRQDEDQVLNGRSEQSHENISITVHHAAEPANGFVDCTSLSQSPSITPSADLSLEQATMVPIIRGDSATIPLEAIDDRMRLLEDHALGPGDVIFGPPRDGYQRRPPQVEGSVSTTPLPAVVVRLNPPRTYSSVSSYSTNLVDIPEASEVQYHVGINPLVCNCTPLTCVLQFPQRERRLVPREIPQKKPKGAPGRRARVANAFRSIIHKFLGRLP
ncbi:hypothetical protein B0I35DRAFT_131235 [Stachybotrys elegans]|uniref:Uncharacterized protein n=1 Tax=Stachybotrys elegans TaxID=80388 RepID=A0A8K0SZT2_9HYPO|nr:hypothetical protein B0I35DRAFT_131235 [Stachybotrys elegans]